MVPKLGFHAQPGRGLLLSPKEPVVVGGTPLGAGRGL